MAHARIKAVQLAAIWFLSLALSCGASFAQSLQTSEQPPLIVGWTIIPPFYQISGNAEPDGYFADLARLIAGEIGLPIEFRRFNTAGEHIAAQNAGEVTFIAGAGSKTMFDAENVFSDPVGSRRLRFFARTGRPGEIDLDGDSVLLTAVLPTIGEAVREALPGTIRIVEVASLSEGLTSLLAGDVDLFLTSEQTAQYWAYRAGLDHLLVPVGPPFESSDRFAVLHRSRADLLRQVNQAIARLREGGQLAKLEQKHRIAFFAPPPEVLAVGIMHYPPFQIVGQDGSFSGFGVEVFRDLAALAELKYKFVEISRAELLAGPSATGYDVIPLSASGGARRAFADFTLPLEKQSVGIYMRRGETGGISGLDDLAGRKVGVMARSQLFEQARTLPDVELVLGTSPGEVLDLLLEGQVDAVLLGQIPAEIWLTQNGKARQAEMVRSAAIEGPRAVALRFGLGDIRERLNEVIPGYILSEDYTALHRKYRQGPVFWTESRKRMATGLFAASLGLLVVLGIGFLSNLRARRQSEALTARTLDISSRLSAVLDAARSGIVALNRSGQVAIANPSARQMLGALDTPVPFAWPERARFLDPTDLSPLLASASPERRILRGAVLEDEQAVLETAEGGPPRQLRLNSTSIAPGISPEIGAVLILDDVTELERNREQAERSSRLSAIGRLTGGVAHDFNNLLAVIMGNLELLRDEDLEAERSGLIDAALGATRRGADLTRNMLAFARRSRLSPERLDLTGVIDEAQEWIGRTLPETVRVETSLQPDLWMVSVDRNSLENALLNLILNARDAMDSRGRLTISASNVEVAADVIEPGGDALSRGRYVMVSVSDSGPGIPEAQLAKIFDPFFTTKAPGQGTGLGLSMVAGFVAQSGGAVRVRSDPGVGTTFNLYFPALAAEPSEESVARTEDRKTKYARNRILLVEDEDAVREVQKGMLERAGHDVTTAETGDDALEIFRNAPDFDLLVTDVIMPGALQGNDLAVAIRKSAPDLPVIFISGYSENALTGTPCDSAEFRLLKPVRRDELLATVARATGDSPELAPSQG